MDTNNTADRNGTVAAPVLYMVIPCYNEEKVLPITSRLFLEKLCDLISSGSISKASRILYVNDGSRDRTWEIIKELAAEDPHVIGICQSRNCGHQNAVLAGLMEARDRCDITISMDCDGQDDINAVDEMLEAYKGGSEIVYGVRSSRETDTWFKRTTAQQYYRFLNRMGVEAVYNHADYRLVSAKVLAHFADFQEVNLFLRGMFPLVGFKSTAVYYKRNERVAGETHYPLRKMLALAVDGITSLSVKPIHLVSVFGFLTAAIGFLGIVWAIVMSILQRTVDGWASTICVVCFLGGTQMLSLGIIGEYVGKTYMETKHRPRYIISERTWKDEQGNARHAVLEDRHR